MTQWQQHPSFSNEFKKFGKKQKNLEDGFAKVKRLLSIYFDPISPNRSIIAPAKIHRISSYTEWELWKIEVMVANLKPNLWPRVWFAVSGDTITLLAINMHNSGYDDNAVERLAIERFEA